MNSAAAQAWRAARKVSKKYTGGIPAPKDFIAAGSIFAGEFNLVREIATGTTIGLALGMLWKTYHWNEKRRVAQYYADLAKRELEDEKAATAATLAKLKELEDELLA